MASKAIPKVKPDSWLLGNIKSYKEDTLGFLLKNAEQYGDIYQFRTAHKRINVVNRPEYVQHVLQKNQRNYKRHFAYKVLQLMLGDGVICIDGEKWKRERRLMQPHFHKESIKSYFSTIDHYTGEMIKTWSGTQEIWLLSEMTNLTLEIITSCFLGGSIQSKGAIVEENLPYALEIILERIQSPIQPPLWIPTRKNQKFKSCIQNLERLVAEIISEKEKDENPVGNDLITMYLLLERKGENISKQQIFDEIITILTAGHETTAIAMYSLVRHVFSDPLVKAKVKEEYNNVVGDNPISLEHLNELKYVNNCINESLRLSTPAWTIGREIIEDDEIDGYPLKKGDSIMVSPYLIHRNPELWPNPEKFDPDRFDQDPVHKYAYFPFGGGPKLCIGMGLALMEMQIILYHVMKSGFDIQPELTEKTEYHASLTLRPTTDIRMIKISNEIEKIVEEVTS